MYPRPHQPAGPRGVAPRANQTLQDRRVKAMWLARIKNQDAAHRVYAHTREYRFVEKRTFLFGVDMAAPVIKSMHGDAH